MKLCKQTSKLRHSSTYLPKKTEKINIFRDNIYSKNSAAKGNLSVTSDVWLHAK